MQNDRIKNSSNFNAVKEKIGYDLYKFLGENGQYYFTPKCKLIDLPLLNEFTK